MNRKQSNTLADIFADPVKANVPWRDVEVLFRALHAVVENLGGSRVGVALNGERAVFHRPHPEKETDKGALKSVRRFLIAAGVEPLD